VNSLLAQLAIMREPFVHRLFNSGIRQPYALLGKEKLKPKRVVYLSVSTNSQLHSTSASGYHYHMASYSRLVAILYSAAVEVPSAKDYFLRNRSANVFAFVIFSIRFYVNKFPYLSHVPRKMLARSSYSEAPFHVCEMFQIYKREPSLADSCIDLICHATFRTNTTSNVHLTLHNFVCISLDYLRIRKSVEDQGVHRHKIIQFLPGLRGLPHATCYRKRLLAYVASTFKEFGDHRNKSGRTKESKQSQERGAAFRVLEIRTPFGHAICNSHAAGTEKRLAFEAAISANRSSPWYWTVQPPNRMVTRMGPCPYAAYFCLLQVSCVSSKFNLPYLNETAEYNCGCFKQLGDWTPWQSALETEVYQFSFMKSTFGVLCLRVYGLLFTISDWFSVHNILLVYSDGKQYRVRILIWEMPRHRVNADQLCVDINPRAHPTFVFALQGKFMKVHAASLSAVKEAHLPYGAYSCHSFVRRWFAELGEIFT
ncbi:hypothetical protein CLF_113088, partial [Clonorchis sinensis]